MAGTGRRRRRPAGRMGCHQVWQMRRIDDIVWTLEASTLRTWRMRGREALNSKMH
jgi:hypothetical protein